MNIEEEYRPKINLFLYLNKYQFCSIVVIIEFYESKQTYYNWSKWINNWIFLMCIEVATTTCCRGCHHFILNLSLLYCRSLLIWLQYRYHYFYSQTFWTSIPLVDLVFDDLLSRAVRSPRKTKKWFFIDLVYFC